MWRSMVIVALGLAAGCEDFEVRQIAPLEDAVIAVDDGLGLARVVRVDGAQAETTEIELSEGAAGLLARPSYQGEVFIFTEGTIGDADEAAVPSELVRVDRTGELGRWTFGRQYADAAASPDGRYVYAGMPWGRLVVENNIEVVDVTRPASADNPLSLSLRSLGGETPRAAVFSEPLAWADGRELRVAALFAAGQLSLYDLDAPEVPPVTIPTTVNGSVVGPAPVEARFVDDELVLRLDSGAQVLVVSLAAQSGTGGQRFEVSLRTLATSGPVTAIAVDRRGTSPRLIALSGIRLHIYDLATGIETALELPTPYERILAFDGPAPGDPTTRPRLALWGRTPSITFVDLGDAANSVVDSETLSLAFRPDEVVADAALGRLVVFRSIGAPVANDVAGSTSRVPVSVIDLYDRSAIALTTADITRAVVSRDLSAMWVANADGYVSRFDVGSHAQEELWLDQDVQTLLPLYGAAQRVIAFHVIESGRFSVLQAGSEPRLVDGVF